MEGSASFLPHLPAIYFGILSANKSVRIHYEDFENKQSVVCVGLLHLASTSLRTTHYAIDSDNNNIFHPLMAQFMETIFVRLIDLPHHWWSPLHAATYLPSAGLALQFLPTGRWVWLKFRRSGPDWSRTLERLVTIPHYGI